VTEATVREQRAATYGIRSNDERDVPLHLLPLLILQFVRQTGTRIYRISVKRTRWRAYNVSVRTRSKLREREPEPAVMVPPGPTMEEAVHAVPVLGSLIDPGSGTGPVEEDAFAASPCTGRGTERATGLEAARSLTIPSGSRRKTARGTGEGGEG